MSNNQNQQPIYLGSTNIEISRIGIGIWSWGDRFFWGYGNKYREEDLEDTYNAIVDSPINFIDTAEVYGMGNSEKILGKFLRGGKKKFVIATKFFPYPWRINATSVKKAIHNSIKRMGITQVDLYQIHMPFPPYPIEFWLQKLVALYHGGFTRAIGVSNFNLDQTRRAHKYLADKGVPLASNQVRYSLLDRDIERTGLYNYCIENNITVIAYSPLAMGMLTGKYTPSTPPRGIRRIAYRYSPKYLRKIHPAIELLNKIGNSHDGKSAAQVALNWVISKGVIPIPGAKNRSQAEDNLGTVNWQLTKDEVFTLEKATENLFSE